MIVLRFLPCLNHVQFWFWFIDDLPIVWTGSRDELLGFLDALNINYFNLKFTYTFNAVDIAFLDLSICIDENGYITTDLYRKPSSGNIILHAQSSHSASLIRSISYAQYLRIRRNCSSEEDFFCQSDLLRLRLSDRE